MSNPAQHIGDNTLSSALVRSPRRRRPACEHSESGEDCSCEYDSTDPPGPLPNTSKRLFYYSDEPLVFLL